MDQAEIKPESLYFIMNDKTFNKSVKCVTEIEERLHPNYNYRNRYFNNELYSCLLYTSIIIGVRGNITSVTS